jgi:hypothetical protein
LAKVELMTFLLTHWPELALTTVLAICAWVFVVACGGGKCKARRSK